jgi:hypothetical protein
MNDIADSVNKALQDCQSIESSSFYDDYRQFSKVYDSLIQEGVTRRRESQLKTIQDKNNIAVLAYNTVRDMVRPPEARRFF